MSPTNFTWEAGRLLGYVGRVATTIRMNSPYNGAGDDVVRLTNSLDGFERLGLALQRSNLQEIEDVCNGLLARFKDYDRPDAGYYGSTPAPTFERQARCTLGKGRAILTEIRDKARALREHEAKA